jgi:hypothetical protein
MMFSSSTRFLIISSSVKVFQNCSSAATFWEENTSCATLVICRCTFCADGHTLAMIFRAPVCRRQPTQPSTFLAGDTDQTHFSPALAETMIKEAQQVEPSASDVVEHYKEGGHCIMISYQEWTADALRAAGETF